MTEDDPLYTRGGEATAGPRAILSYYRELSEKDPESASAKTRALFHLTKDELDRLLGLYSMSESSSLREDYPSNFSWEELSKVRSFAGRLRYASERLERISSGSSRVVFAIDDKKVLKVAKNDKGVAQNEAEREFSDDSYLTGMFAEVFTCSPDCRFLEMERARKCTKREFEKYTGVSMDTVWQYLAAYDNLYLHPGRGYPVREPEGFDELHENDFLMSIVDYAGGFNVPIPGDFTKLSSYGFVKRDGKDTLVMVDYGFTEALAKVYHRR